MGEAWDDLDTFRRLRAECADGIKEITTACARDHPQHKHVIECRECYEKVIDRMRSRYSDAKATEKWFSVTVEPTRKELDELFTAAKEYKVGLAEIDRRAEEERKRSYAHQVKASPSIRKSLEELVDGKELFASIGVKDATFDEVVAEVRKALRGPGVVKAEAGAEDAEKALQRLMEAKTPEERLQAYKQTFFSEKPDEAVAGKTQMYLDRLEEGATMDDIVNKIAVDRRSSIGAMDRKEMHKKRIEELRRARAAHELEKQRKASKDSVQNRQPTDAAYNAAPCNACGRQIDTLDYTACPICIALVEAGIRRKATTFCAKPKCFNGGYGYEAHLEAAHLCASGDYCTQLTDDDVDMDKDPSAPYFCNECLDKHDVESVFCTVRCADANFQRHREQIHLPERRRRNMDDPDRECLVWENEFRQRYHAKDIHVHITATDALVADWQAKNNVDDLNPVTGDALRNY